ncbi:MAG: DUF502 domain-containing protein [Deltaproteobacteria bacterium]|nr:DUF502 domain-containing protein [Deltaproteobacteria bacterium]
MKRIRTAFVTGLLVLVPLLATIDLLWWFVRSVDAKAQQILFFPFDVPGLGLIIALGLIILVGFFTQNYIGSWIVTTFDNAIRRIRFIGGIYGGIKKFLETIINPRSDQFKGVVLIEFPRPGIYSVGFRTGQPDPKLVQNTEKLVNVFVPCTPNPTSGFYMLVREQELIPLNLSVQEAFKVVISMGIVTTEDASKK